MYSPDYRCNLFIRNLSVAESLMRALQSTGQAQFNHINALCQLFPGFFHKLDRSGTLNCAVILRAMATMRHQRPTAGQYSWSLKHTKRHRFANSNIKIIATANIPPIYEARSATRLRSFVREDHFGPIDSGCL